MENKYTFKTQIIDNETDETILELSSNSQEGLEEEMGKTKYINAIDVYEEYRDRVGYDEEPVDHYDETIDTIEANNQSLQNLT